MTAGNTGGKSSSSRYGGRTAVGGDQLKILHTNDFRISGHH